MEAFDNSAFGFAIAMAVGMVAQVAARHLRLPGIVMLLAAGAAVGPDGLGLVRPEALGDGLHLVVGMAVAVILFEGGMQLDVRRLRAEALIIRRLVTLGAVITAVGSGLAALLIMGWDWRLSILFGTLCIVTGPTVVTPLVRRLRVEQPASTILEAEGVLIDPIGAIIAVVALELLYADASATALARPLVVLAGGAVLGGLVGGLIVLLLRRPGLIPDGLENVLVLSLVVALFEVSEAVLAESGLAAVVASGLVVGNVRARAGSTLMEFKEQLTTLLIGLLFILLVADVRFADVRALGGAALITVAVLVFVVRPLQVFLCAIGTPLSWRERTFVGSLAPRGIVAAAVASLFAETLAERGLVAATDFRAMMFVVIGVTVTFYGLAGGPLARLLRLRRPSERGWVILGAHGLALRLGELLREEQQEVVYIDSNPRNVRLASEAGYIALLGQGLDEGVLAAADPGSRVGCIAFTPNEEVNVLWATKLRAETRMLSVWTALRGGVKGLPLESAHNIGAAVLFGQAHDTVLWAVRMDRGFASVEWWMPGGDTSEALVGPPSSADGYAVLLPMAWRRGTRVRPLDESYVPRFGDQVAIAIYENRRADAEAWLRERGWEAARPTVVAAE